MLLDYQTTMMLALVTVTTALSILTLMNTSLR